MVQGRLQWQNALGIVPLFLHFSDNKWIRGRIYKRKNVILYSV